MNEIIKYKQFNNGNYSENDYKFRQNLWNILKILNTN